MTDHREELGLQTNACQLHAPVQKTDETNTNVLCTSVDNATSTVDLTSTHSVVCTFFATMLKCYVCEPATDPGQAREAHIHHAQLLNSRKKDGMMAPSSKARGCRKAWKRALVEMYEIVL